MPSNDAIPAGATKAAVIGDAPGEISRAVAGEISRSSSPAQLGAVEPATDMFFRRLEALEAVVLKLAESDPDARQLAASLNLGDS